MTMSTPPHNYYVVEPSTGRTESAGVTTVIGCTLRSRDKTLRPHLHAHGHAWATAVSARATQTRAHAAGPRLPGRGYRGRRASRARRGEAPVATWHLAP